MNGDELKARVEEKLKEARTQEYRMASLEVHQEEMLDKLEKLPCVSHAKQINLIRGGIVALGFVASLGLLQWWLG